MNKDNIKDLNSLLTEAEVEAKLNSLIKSLEEELEAEGTEDKEPEEIDATKLEVEPVGTEDEKKAEDVAETVNEDVVAEDTLEIDPVTTKAEAEGAEDKVAEPIAPAAEETEAPVKTEVEVEVSRAEDAVEPESPIADAEIERPAIEIDPLKVVEEQLENIFAILRESESDEAVKDGHQEIEDAAKKEVKVNDSDIKKDTAEDVNDNKGEAHEVKVEADATEDKVEEKENAGEKVADEVAKEIEAGIVKEELEAEGTEDREPKEVEASEVEVEPAGTDEGKEVEDVAETVNEEADLTLEEMVEIISMLSDDALLEFLSDLNGSEYNILSENIELSESVWDWAKRRAREIRDIHRFNNPLGLKNTIKKVNRMDAKAKIRELKGSEDYKKATWRKKYDDNGIRIGKTKAELKNEIYNKQKQNDKDMIAAAKKTAEENRTTAAKKDFEIKRNAAQAKLNKLNSKYNLGLKNKDNEVTSEYKSNISNNDDSKKTTAAKNYEANNSYSYGNSGKGSDNISMIKNASKKVENNSRADKYTKEADKESLETPKITHYENYSDLDLMNILVENDYEATVENLLVLKEGLSSGEYVIEELEAEGTEDREPKEVEASEVEVEPAGTEDEKKAEDVAETVNEEAEVVTPDIKEGTEEPKEETEPELSREEVMGKEEVVDDAKSETVYEEYINNVLEEALKDFIEDATKRGKVKKNIKAAFRANADKYDLIKKQGLLSDKGMSEYEALTDEEKKEYHRFSNGGIKELKKVYDKKKDIELSEIKANRSRKKLQSLKEAFQLGSSYFCTPDRIQDLQEKIALLVAKENDDLLFQEMVKCTQLAESFKNRLLNKYSIISENRTSEFLQLMQESEACMDAVENREPKEVEASAVEVSPVGSEDEIIKTDVEPEVNDEKKNKLTEEIDNFFQSREISSIEEMLDFYADNEELTEGFLGKVKNSLLKLSVNLLGTKSLNKILESIRTKALASKPKEKDAINEKINNLLQQSNKSKKMFIKSCLNEVPESQIKQADEKIRKYAKSKNSNLKEAYDLIESTMLFEYDAVTDTTTTTISNVAFKTGEGETIGSIMVNGTKWLPAFLGMSGGEALIVGLIIGLITGVIATIVVKKIANNANYI